MPEASAPAAGRIGVHGVWQAEVGPVLSLGMLTAAARHWDDGALTEHYDIHRPDIADATKREDFRAKLKTALGR